MESKEKRALASHFRKGVRNEIYGKEWLETQLESSSRKRMDSALKVKRSTYRLWIKTNEDDMHDNINYNAI